LCPHITFVEATVPIISLSPSLLLDGRELSPPPRHIGYKSIILPSRGRIGNIAYFSLELPWLDFREVVFFQALR
jgi:hypothetical protein